MFADQSLNNNPMTEENFLKNDKNVVNADLEKDIDDFLEINELMTGMNIKDDKQEDFEMEMEEDELENLEGDDEFLQDPELEKEFLKPATAADKLKKRYEVIERADDEKEFEDEIEYRSDIFLHEK